MKRLEDFKFVISNWMTYKIPYVMDRYITLPTDTSMIVAVTGPRRAGKTFLLFGYTKLIFYPLNLGSV